MTASITASIPRGAHVEHTDLRAISFHHVRFLGLERVDVDITGEIQDVTINGVDIGPLIEAELNRRMPDRARMRPTTVGGFQEAWAILERPRLEDFPLSQCLFIVVNEEWHHRLYAERDLDALVTATES